MVLIVSMQQKVEELGMVYMRMKEPGVKEGNGVGIGYEGEK